MTPTQTRLRATLAIARGMFEDAMRSRACVDDALAQVGGRVTVDLVRHGREWALAGEWEDVPKHLIRRPTVTARHEASDARFISGNCDELAAIAGMSEDDFRDFLRANPVRPKYQDFLEDAEACYASRTMSQTASTAAERKAAQRARARAEGRCVICCREAVSPGNSTCHACGKRANAAKKAKRAA